jgi:hypothetical protein
LDGSRGEGRVAEIRSAASARHRAQFRRDEWDWNTPKAYLHDEIATDRNNPTVNAHGIIYGATEASSDFIPWLDPVDNKAGLLKTEYRDPKTPSSKEDPIYADSPYWGKRRSGTATPTSITRCMTARDGCG